jgi:signal transduction histidine kinase
LRRRAGERSLADVKGRLAPLVAGLSLAVLGVVLATVWISLRQPFSGLFWIEGTGVVTGVFPGSPAAAAGLRAGDVILELGGWPTSSVRRSTAASSSRIGETLPVTFRRDGAVRSSAIGMVGPPTLARLHRLEAPLIALCFALLGFAVWAHKPYDRTVVMFLLFSYSIALLLAAGSLSSLGLPGAFLGYIGLMSVTAAVAVDFHLLFPRARAVPGRLRAGLYTLALVPPVLYLPGLLQDADLEWYTLALSAATAYFVAGVVALAALLSRAYRTTSSEEERRRVRLVVFGTALGSAPGIALSLLPEVLSHDRRFFVPWEVTLPFLLLIPVAYVVAIQRHDLLRVERLANRGVVHLIVFSTLVVVSVAVALALPRLAPWTDGPIASTLVVLLVALLFGPMRRRLQKVADGVVYGGWYDYRSVLGEMTQGLAGIVDADTLADLLGRRLPQILRVEGASLLLPGGDVGLEEASGSGWPGDGFSVALDRSGPLGLALVRASRPLTSAELAAAAESPGDEDVAWLRRPEIELWVPLVLRETLQGVLLLGAKPGDEPFDAEDRRLLGTLAWSAAVAVENVRLFSALRRRADEVNQLYSQLLQSREEERKRLARELHDRVIQDLVNLNYLLEAGPADAASKATVDAVRERLRRVVDSLRQVSTELRPAALDDLSLGLAVRGYLEEARDKYALRISLRLPAGSHDRLEALPEEVRVSLFRVLQEAVQNVHRHARASRVEVDLALQGEAVTLEVRDDGRGFQCPAELGGLVRQRHFGLAGAQERMGLVGGRLELVSEVGRGTTLRATAPLAGEG